MIFKNNIVNALINLGAAINETTSDYIEFGNTEHISIETIEQGELWAELITVTEYQVSGWIEHSSSIGKGLHRVYTVPLKAVCSLVGQAEGSRIIVSEVKNDTDNNSNTPV